MSKLLDRFAQLMLQPVSKGVIGILSLYTILWGIWVVNPWANTFVTSPLYDALLHIIPSEFVWGLIALVAGCIALLGIGENYPRSGFWGAAVNGIFWLIIAIFYFAGDLASTGGITALFLAVLSGYVYLNCKVKWIKDHEEAEN